MSRKYEINPIDNGAMCFLEENTNVFQEPVESMKILLSQLKTLGIAFDSLMPIVQGSAGKSGIYFVNTQGKEMFKNKAGKFIGSLKDVSGKVGGGQATITHLPVDPASLCLAAALYSIEKSLKDIKSLQEDMMHFLIQKEKSEQKANLIFLLDLYHNYKHNHDNQMYLTNNHTLVLSIRKDAEEKIDFYRELIQRKIKSHQWIHNDGLVKKMAEEMVTFFNEYQLALYTLAFSLFLEIILSKNFNEEYLNNISEKLESYSYQYRYLYTKSYNYLEKYSNTSMESTFLQGVARVTLEIGKFTDKIPFVKTKSIKAPLIDTHEKLNNFNEYKVSRQMMELINRQSHCIRPFKENIDQINKFYNKPVQFVVDSENLYVDIMA